MDSFEKYIKENRQSFSQEPPAGHFDRFGEKLGSGKEKGKVLRLLPGMLKVAVISLLVVISGIWTFERISGRSHNEGLSLGDVSPEYREVEQFYVHEVSLTCNKLKDPKMYESEEQKQVILKELADMDSIYSNLKKDLSDNPNDERVISAMIGHYQMKLEIMNSILQQLYEINETNKYTDHEKSNI